MGLRPDIRLCEDQCGLQELTGRLEESRMADKKNKVQAAPLFQTVTLKKKNGRDCKFIVFNRKQFLNRYKELK